MMKDRTMCRSVMESMPDARFCWHLVVLGPAPGSPPKHSPEFGHDHTGSLLQKCLDRLADLALAHVAVADHSFAVQHKRGRPTVHIPGGANGAVAAIPKRGPGHVVRLDI